jgi:hypothetical protein
MSEHDDRRDHDAKADELEGELDEMQEHSDELGEEIDSAAEEWERRKADDRVPGAAGEPEQADGPEPEAEYPNKRAGDDGEELDFGRSLAEGDDERGDGDS